MIQSNKKEILKFNTDYDLSLLREVYCHNLHNDRVQWYIHKHC
jgi:hypothetical protein